MNTNLQAEAKEVINEFFEMCYFPLEILTKIATDPRFKDENFISKDVADAVFEILLETNLYDVAVNLYDDKDNLLAAFVIRGCDEKYIHKTIDELVGETNGATHGKISKFLPIT